MTCVMCKHGSTRPGQANVVLQRGSATIIVKGVPADVCENCGEHYLSNDISKRILIVAEQAVAHGAEIEVVRFAA